MNWQKYSIDEWLEQFGIWCQQCTQKGGHLPDGLHVNQIYYLMQSVEPSPSITKLCEISDDEAWAVNHLLCRAKEVLPMQIEFVILHKVQGRSLREIAQMENSQKDKVRLAIENGCYYLAGLQGLTV